MYVKPNGNKFDFGYSYYPALNKEIDKGQSLSVDLNHFNGKSGEGSVTGVSYPPLKEGDEVWITIPIVLGNTKSCQKDGHKLVYKKDVNKTMKFKSSGTTLNDNRCKADGNMDDVLHRRMSARSGTPSGKVAKHEVVRGVEDLREDSNDRVEDVWRPSRA